MQTKAEDFRYDLLCLIVDFEKVFTELRLVEWAIRLYPYLIDIGLKHSCSKSN